MVVVKIEIWPLGNEKKAREIGRMQISNDGTGTSAKGDYDVEVLHGGSFYGKPGFYRTGRVEGFLRRKSPYHLVSKALQACGIR